VSNPRIISDEDLHAYIDGALDEARALEVEKLLAENPSLAERAALFQADKALLKSLYAPLVERPLPGEWVARVHRQPPPRSPVKWIYAIAAALVIAAVSPLAVQYYLPRQNADVVEAALDAREGSPAGERSSITRDGLTTGRYDAALRQTIASNVHIPDLSRMGYRLRGLHLYQKAAEIVYRGPQDQLFTLYVRRSDGTARFDQFERRGLRVCIWQDDQISTVMAGNISAAVMQRLATLSYTGLTSS